VSLAKQVAAYMRGRRVGTHFELHLKGFLDHCSVMHQQYVLDQEVVSSFVAFANLHVCHLMHQRVSNFFLNPMTGKVGHYQSFSEVYGRATSEKHYPSAAFLQRKKTLLFASNLCHVENVDMILQCEECEIWYSQKSLLCRNVLN